VGHALCYKCWTNEHRASTEESEEYEGNEEDGESGDEESGDEESEEGGESE